MTLAGQLQDLRKVRASLERKLEDGVAAKKKRGGGDGTPKGRSSPTRANTTLGFEPGGEGYARSGGGGGGGGSRPARARTEVALGSSASRRGRNGSNSDDKEDAIAKHAAELERREESTRKKLAMLKAQLSNDQRSLHGARCFPQPQAPWILPPTLDSCHSI